ncbi:MAG: ABC-2 transporter permease [Solobacterium sp.]|nr:ABC-2 transporter permease [Solobacterium sp.]
MKALLAKDYGLMKQRGKILLFLVLWAIAMNLIMVDSMFVVGWVVMIAEISSISTISYDEYDNCMPFLMSLPVTRRDYALEKFVFPLMCGILFWIISVIIVAVSGMFTGNSISLSTDLPGMVLFLILMMLIPAMSVPPQLKWGAEKGRIVMFIFFAILMVVSYLLNYFKVDLEETAEQLSRYPMYVVFLAVFLICLVILSVSVYLSIRIMEKKEF